MQVIEVVAGEAVQGSSVTVPLPLPACGDKLSVKFEVEPAVTVDGLISEALAVKRSGAGFTVSCTVELPIVAAGDVGTVTV